MHLRSLHRRWWMSLAIAAAIVSAVSWAAVVGGAGSAPRSDLAHSGDNLLRLHVIAHSDAPAEQEVKLSVRDALLLEMASWQPPTSGRAFEAYIGERKERLVEVAEGTLRQAGFVHPVRVEIGRFPFPEKRSGEILLPAGEYRAVKVVIGAGEGHNWWCVLFPPLCFVERDGEPVVVRGESAAEAAPAPPFRVAEGLEPEADPADPLGGAEDPDAGGAIAWRLRLWERLSANVYAERLLDLLHVSTRAPAEITP